MKVKTLEDLNIIKEKGWRSLYPDAIRVNVGLASCGISSGAGKIHQALCRRVEEGGVNVQIRQAGCIGFCQKEPIVDILEPGLPRVFYAEMTSKKALELLCERLAGRLKKEWTLCRLDGEELLIEWATMVHSDTSLCSEASEIPHYQDIPFFSKQIRVALRNCGLMDPESIEEYVARGGYLSLYRALNEMEPEEIIAQVKASGLRGRGGGGFPTGVKWESCRRAEGDIKYVLCNADEGDPGAYMDRALLEGDPHSVIEGMIIGAYAIGANQGFVYIRDEYPLALKRLRLAVSQAEGLGLLGQDIFSSGFDFGITLCRGGGAFVCGESTALMASIEGNTGEPRAKHIHTVEKGLWDRPSNLNNVETWANVPVIVARGADWFAGMGSQGSKGTKVFSLVGKVANTGLVEVPMGISLREVIYDVGGGIPGHKRFKSIQTGGPSGGCLPEALLDLPVDFDALTEAGSMMGSGGLVVMDEATCMVDVAKYFTGFLKEESCGKCTSCREGLKRLYQILARISEGQGADQDLELIQELSWVISQASLCALGGSAPNPVLSTLRYFKEEYEAHIYQKRCPAGVCRPLIKYWIDPDYCNACGECLEGCTEEAIFESNSVYAIDQARCDKCGSCYDICQYEAVKIE